MPGAAAEAPTLSVVVEWENCRHSAKSRASRMLSALFEQIQENRERLGHVVEVLLVVDPGEAARPDIPLPSAAPEGVSFSTAVCHGLDYYEQKNFGAERARGELLLFVDSDVIPQPGWLRALLDCQAETRAPVICGRTDIDGESLYAKAFRLFWFFPGPGEWETRTETDHFYANNVMFERQLFQRFRFPDSPIVRGRCLDLAARLREAGCRPLLEPRARTGHPAPNGLGHFLKRAACEGHDIALRARANRRPLGRAVGEAAYRARQSAARILRRRRAVDLSLPGAIVAILIAGGYHAVALGGELVSLRHAAWLRRRVRV